MAVNGDGGQRGFVARSGAHCGGGAAVPRNEHGKTCMIKVAKRRGECCGRTRAVGGDTAFAGAYRVLLANEVLVEAGHC
jgi:hypothetical protein